MRHLIPSVMDLLSATLSSLVPGPDMPSNPEKYISKRLNSCHLYFIIPTGTERMRKSSHQMMPSLGFYSQVSETSLINP